MTKRQDVEWKGLGGRKGQQRFLAMFLGEQIVLGAKSKGWAIAYGRKCSKRDATCPIDELTDA